MWKLQSCYFLFCVLGAAAYAAASPIHIKDSSFVKDSSLELRTNNVFKYLDEGETDTRNVHEAWGHGVSFDYKSGYINNFIGVDGSYYGVIKLAASDNFSSRGVLYNDNGQASGFNKIGQFYSKVKFSEFGINGNIYSGWKLLKLGVLTTSMRAAPNTYRGVSGDLAWNDYRLRMAYVDKSSNRDSPNKVHFTTSEGRQIDSIYTGELQYKSDTLTALYFYGESQNYLRRNGLELAMKENKSLVYGMQIYTTDALGKYDSMKSSKKDFDSNATHYAIDMTWKPGNWLIKPGFEYTQAHKSNGIGQFPRHMSKNSRGTFNSMASAGLDYMRDEEKVISLDIGYNVTPELLVGVNTHYGFFNYKSQAVKEGEFNVYTLWKPIKDLSIFTLAGPGRTFEHKGTTPIEDSNGIIKKSNSMAYEFRVDYKFNIF